MKTKTKIFILLILLMIPSLSFSQVISKRNKLHVLFQSTEKIEIGDQFAVYRDFKKIGLIESVKVSQDKIVCKIIREDISIEPGDSMKPSNYSATPATLDMNSYLYTKKDAALAGLFSFFLPGVGNFYAQNRTAGILFFGMRIGALVAYSNSVKKGNKPGRTAEGTETYLLVSGIALGMADMACAAESAVSYNNKLKSKLNIAVLCDPGKLVSFNYSF